MREYFPILFVGAVAGVFSLIFLLAWLRELRTKTAPDFDRNIPDGEIVRRLLKYALPYKKEFALVLAVMLASIAYELASPLIMGRVEELIKDRFEPSVLLRWIALYACMLLVSMACTYLQSILLQKTGQKILSALRQDLFTHIESLSHDQLNKIPVGKLVTRVANDTNAISMVFTNVLVNMARNAFIVLGVLGAMLLLNYALTLMILCFVPFLVLFTVIFRKFTRKVHRVVKDRTTDLNTFLSENLSGIKITQIFNQEERKLGDFLSKSDALKKAKQNQIFVFGIFRPMVYMLYVSSILCLFYLGGKGYIQDTVFLGQVMTSGTIVSFYMYISKFFNPIQTLAEQFNMLQSAFASAEKIFSVFDLEPEVVDAPDAVELDHIRGEIEFEDVWFAYEPGEWVLKGVSFHVDARQTAAFVGATGSGKTTILSLLCRNYDIQKGRILIDGRDIRTIKLSSLRRQFGQMLQDVFLFSGTIRSNIVLREEGFADIAALFEGVAKIEKEHEERYLHRTAGQGAGRGGPGAGRELLRRTAAAPQLCPHHHPPPGGHDPGRGHRQHRHRDGAAHTGLPGEAALHRHHAHRGPPPVHHPARRPDHRAVPRRDRGAGQPPGAAGKKGAVLPALHPAIQQGEAAGGVTPPAVFLRQSLSPTGGKAFCA